MKNKLLLLFLILLGLILIVFVNSKLSNQTKIETQIYQSKTDEKGDVVVEATPTKLSTKENSEFTITLTTHSVDLNYDLKNIAILSDDRGNKYKPLYWTGGKGGHHLEGALIFLKLSQDVSSVTLKIPGIDNQDRIFTWDLK